LSHNSAEYGSLLVAMGRIPEAEAALNIARTIATKLIEEHPDVPDYREDLQLCYLGRGRMDAVLGRSQEAESSFLKTLSIREQLDAQDATRMGGGGRDAALIRRSLGDLLRSSGNREGAASYYRRSLEALETIAGKQADSPLDWHNLAWFLATCPDPRFRDPGRAISWAERAVEHSPTGRFGTTLGVARYRNGDWRGAITDLERSMALNDGGTATDWYFLAMAHHRLGDNRQAHQWLDRAVAWMAENKPKDVELALFRGEAQSTLAGAGPSR
jgi:tetratricopeptide (TPR) repeat protein